MFGSRSRRRPAASENGRLREHVIYVVVPTQQRRIFPFPGKARQSLGNPGLVLNVSETGRATTPCTRTSLLWVGAPTGPPVGPSTRDPWLDRRVGFGPLSPQHFQFEPSQRAASRKLLRATSEHARKDVQQKHELSRSFCCFSFLGSIQLDGI